MVKYTEISDLNSDQIELINKNGWCIFTETEWRLLTWKE